MRAQRQKIKLLQDGKTDDSLDKDIMLARARYRGLSQEYREFSKVMSLPEQRQRVTVDGLGSIGRGKVKVDKSVNKKPKPLKSGVDSGIIREQSKKPITKITDSAINRVPKVDIPTYTDEQNSFIQKQHKELLQYAVDENEHKEVAFAFNDRLEKIGEGFQGTDDKLDLGNALIGKGKDLIVMHNHPRNSSFSNQDIALFNSPIIKTLTIVKNNGNVEFVTKLLNEFDYVYNQMAFERLTNKYKKTGSVAEYNKAISVYLNKLQEKGEILWIK